MPFLLLDHPSFHKSILLNITSFHWCNWISSSFSADSLRQIQIFKPQYVNFLISGQNTKKVGIDFHNWIVRNIFVIQLSFFAVFFFSSFSLLQFLWFQFWKTLTFVCESPAQFENRIKPPLYVWCSLRSTMYEKTSFCKLQKA